MKEFSLEEIAKTFFGFDDPQRAATKVSQLAHFDGDEPIEKTDGVSPDYIFRGRLQFLAAQTASLHQQVQFSDAKGAMLITALGFIAARGGYRPGFDSITAVFDLVFYLGLAGAFASVLFAVAPRYPSQEARTNIAQRERFSWPGALGGAEAPDYAAFMNGSSPRQMVASMARCNVALSDILRRKYRALRYGFIFGGAALAGLACGILSRL